MIQTLARKQNWAKASPWMRLISTLLLLFNYNTTDAMFWALLNIPLYLFHQAEEHYMPGGFKDFMNQKIYNLPKGEETLTDIKIFWIIDHNLQYHELYDPYIPGGKIKTMEPWAHHG